MTPSTLALTVILLAGGTAARCLARAEVPAASRNDEVHTLPAPKIRLGASSLDAGRILAGTIVRHAYVFTNTGDAPLILTNAVGSCDCTKVEAMSARVEPSKEGVVAVEFDSTGFSGETAQFIAIGTNDPQQPRIVLTFKATVLRPIELSPTTALFALKPDTLASETKVIRILNHTAQPLQLEAPVSTNAAFAAELKKIIPGTEFELRVSVVPPFATGTLREDIKIRTNHSQMPVLHVPAVLVVRAPSAK